MGFTGASEGKECACNAGDLGLIPGLGRSPGEGNGYPLQYPGLEHFLDCKGNQCWMFIGRIDAEAETPILWPHDAKNRLIGKDPDDGKDWRQEEKGTRGWIGWMASPTLWTWVSVSSRSRWWTGKPGVLHSMGSQRFGHDWVTELNWTDTNIWSRKWQPTEVFLSGKFHEQRSLVDYNPWGHKESVWATEHAYWYIYIPLENCRRAIILKREHLTSDLDFSLYL